MRKKPIQISELLWEYEDQLPPMYSDDFETLYQYSRVIDGVRMYPFIEDSVGSRIWIANLKTQPQP
jgi:hypothetical protein